MNFGLKNNANNAMNILVCFWYTQACIILIDTKEWNAELCA